MIRIEDLDSLLEKAEEDRRQRYLAADRDFVATAGAIKRIRDLLVRLSHQMPAPPTAAPPLEQDKPKESTEVWPGIRNAIRHLITKTPDRFTLDDVMVGLEKNFRQNPKRVNVSGELWRLNRNGEIAIIEKGSGSRPNVYARTVSARHALDADEHNGMILLDRSDAANRHGKGELIQAKSHSD